MQHLRICKFCIRVQKYFCYAVTRINRCIYANISYMQVLLTCAKVVCLSHVSKFYYAVTRQKIKIYAYKQTLHTRKKDFHLVWTVCIYANCGHTDRIAYTQIFAYANICSRKQIWSRVRCVFLIFIDLRSNACIAIYRIL